MKYCISKLLHDVVAAAVTLQSVYKIIPEGGPVDSLEKYLKSTLHRILTQRPSKTDLKNIYEDLKKKFKKLPTESRNMFRTLIMQLIQVHMGTLELLAVTESGEWQNAYDKFKTLTKQDWNSLTEASNMRSEGLTKGVPSGQVKGPQGIQMPTC
jgi:hypothetical protein